MSEQLSQLLSDLEEQKVIDEVNRRVESGIDAFEIFDELKEGMEIVGQRYEAKEYFLSELIMAADILKSAAEPLEEKLKTRDSKPVATMVLGTVLEDVHDIGKNIVSIVFKSNGFKVIDLGEDVPIADFVEAVKEHKPEFVGLSCLLTTTFDNMKATIEAIEKEGLREGRKILIGGGPVTSGVADYVGADGFSTDAYEAVGIAKKMLEVQ